MTIEILKRVDLILFYDTETSGLPLFNKPSSDAGQPHIVDICGLLYTPEGELVDEYESIVMPEGWVIPPEITAIHGITHEFAVINGTPEKDVVRGFGQINKRASLRVGHNVQFDEHILRIGIKRFFGDEAADRFKLGETFCTANTAKPIMKCPPTAKMLKSSFRNSFKMPNLTEALLYFTGKTLSDAHRARPDTQACADIYFAMKKMQTEG